MRIRTIKPEFFLNEELAELSPLHRLFFIGLWCQSDNEGRMHDRPKRFRAQILPYDDCDPEEILNDLERSGHIERYQVDGAPYVLVPTFKKHQRISGKALYIKSDIPAPLDVVKKKCFTGETKNASPVKKKCFTGETKNASPVKQVNPIENFTGEAKVNGGREGKGREELLVSPLAMPDGEQPKKATATARKPSTYDKVWNFLTLPREKAGLGLSDSLAACACRILRSKGGDWSAHCLGALWYCVERPPEPYPENIVIFARGCLNGRTMAREDADGYSNRARVLLDSFDRQTKQEIFDESGHGDSGETE